MQESKTSKPHAVQNGDTAAARGDEELLASLGYKQEFKREFSGVEVRFLLHFIVVLVLYPPQTFGIAFSIIGLLPSIA